VNRPTQIFTVSSPEFLLGTRVMLHSFLAHNPWFYGQLIVLHARLSAQDVALLEAQFDQVLCLRASAALDAAISCLVAAFPHLANRSDRFLSLEMLAHSDQSTRLFLDSDTLICGDVGSLSELPGSLIACPDASMLRGLERDAETLAEAEPVPGAPVRCSFNAGVILLDGQVCTDMTVAEMLARLDPESWKRIASDHTDQAIWNGMFRETVSLADWRFNFMVGHEHLYGKVLDREDIRLLHFNGPMKPWLPESHRFPRNEMAAWANGRWRVACQQMLDDVGQGQVP
jgi:Glycosyl transferase family 8